MLALSSQPQPFAIAAHAQLARTSTSALWLTLASSAFAASTSAASAPTASSDVTCSHDHCWHSWKNAALILRKRSPNDHRETNDLSMIFQRRER